MRGLYVKIQSRYWQIRVQSAGRGSELVIQMWELSAFQMVFKARRLDELSGSECIKREEGKELNLGGTPTSKRLGEGSGK